MMDYKVIVEKVSEEAPKQKMNLDLGSIDKIHAFKLAGLKGDDQVSAADRQAYDQKMNLFFLFGKGHPMKMIDDLSPPQLDILYKQRHFQKLRKLINFAIDT